MFDVITVGSATLDVFAKTKFSELIKIIDPKGETDLLAYPSGSKILIEELEFSSGGGGTNTAVAFSRLGHKVGFIGKLGEGTNSEFVHKSLRKEKVNLLCSHGKGHIGYSIILDNLEHDRTILTYKGINDQLHHDDVPFKKLKTKWFYFCSMMNESFHTMENLAEFAEKNRIKIAFNPSSYLTEKGPTFLKNILSRTELLILNKEEACMLGGKLPVKELMLSLRKLGPKTVVVTDGKNEIYAMHNGFIYSAKPKKIKVVDPTGAGDAFAASFLSGMMKRNDVEFAMNLGVVNAQSVVSYYGAKNILLTFGEAVKAMKKSNLKVSKKKI
ncbi:MAG TPA: carbohydrate kinase family protein [Candidatus Nanoarchaeia archaeon]|nr:carbohydrate kinase family protein [Candidatus Nanoarchaeia archaeon]